MSFGRVVLALVALQGALWISAPLIFEGSIRLDVAEGAIDGPEWRLSYLRHPPLSTWLTGLASETGPFRYAAVHAIGWALACGAFAGAAFFVRRVDRREAGLVALVAGLTTPAATYVPIQVNHNLTLMAFWSATLAAAWFAFEGGALAQWALFGAVVGCAIWAKYAILHLLVPLAILFALTPTWRAQALRPGPWLAALIAAAIAAPHFVDAFARGATTIAYALEKENTAPLARLGWIAAFAGDCLASNVLPAAIACLAVGVAPTASAARQMLWSASATRLDRFLATAAIGPVLLVLVAALFGKTPHHLWTTAFFVSWAAFWGRAASRAAAPPDGAFRLDRLAVGYGLLTALGLLVYAAVQTLAPSLGAGPRYQDFDGPRVARMAEDYWASHEAGPIPYLISYGEERTWPAAQAAGSISFDLPYRAHTLVEADPARSSWIDVADLKWRGALVVSLKPLRDGDKLLGVPVRDLEERFRPVIRGSPGSPGSPIFFAVLPPGS